MKLVIFISSRADYGILTTLINEIIKNCYFDLYMIVGGDSNFINFIRKEKLNCTIYYKKFIDDSKNPSDIIANISNGFKLLNQIFKKHSFDHALVLGDRYEIYPFVISCNQYSIPISHIHGGESTLGSIDDLIRHSVSKLSSLHFVSHISYKRRLLKMGEDENYVFNVGSLSSNYLSKKNLLSKESLRKLLKINFNKHNLIFTFHPVTNQKIDYGYIFSNLLKAFNKFKCLNIFITMPNNDSESFFIRNEIYNKFSNKKNIFIFESLGYINYLSLASHCNALIGNSSSGIIEGPSLKVFTINMGDRQLGRVFAKSIINVGYTENEITAAIKFCINMENKKNIKNIKNPFYQKNTVNSIIRILMNVDKFKLLPKRFSC